MRIAMIPARGGSKRIPRKNIKPFAGIPIIAHSIKAALDSGCFDRVILSTDDAEIADVARAYGAEVPFWRPDDIANDTATTMQVIQHCLSWLENQGNAVSALCCIYATAPFIRLSDLQAGWQLLQEDGVEYVFPVCGFGFPVQRGLCLDTQHRIHALQPEHMNTRSQDLPEAVHDCGQFYWGKAAAFRAALPLYSEHAKGLLIPRYRVQDIDTAEDWRRAEIMYRVLQETGE